MFENPKNWEELRSNVLEILKKNKAGEEIERGKFEPEQAKNPPKKPLADLMEEEGGWFDGPEDKKRFEFIMPD